MDMHARDIVQMVLIGLLAAFGTVALIALLGIGTELIWGGWNWRLLVQIVLALEATLFSLQALSGGGEPWARRWDTSDPQAEFPLMGIKQSPRQSEVWWLLPALVIGLVWILFGLYV
ncbi:MAG TPA: hypothetical protein VHA53_02410 [Nitrolancea sp.]|nr:hypothetical protein [Nitrolancea sp.]